MVTSLVWSRLFSVLLLAGMPFPSFFWDDRRPAEAIRLEESERWREAESLYAQKAQQEPDWAVYWRGESERCRFQQELRRQCTAPAVQAYLKQLTLLEATETYGETLELIRSHAAEPIAVQRLAETGMRRVAWALDNPTFCRLAFPAGLAETERATLKAELASRWLRTPAADRAAAVRAFQGLLTRWQQNHGAAPAPLAFVLIGGACAAVDAYTSFLPPFWHEKEAQAGRSDLGGAGLAFSQHGEVLMVRAVAPGSPAAEAGIAVNAQALSVEGHPAASLSLDEAELLLLGPTGSPLTIEWQPPFEPAPRRTVLRRRPLNQPTVPEARLVDEPRGIGYLQILLFDENTPAELDQALRKLHSVGAKVLIVDLRGNPGGLLSAAAAAASRLAPADRLAFSTQGRGKEANVYYRTRGGPALAAPLVVMIDGDTASAAEALAAALEEQAKAITVGSTTWGKGTVQRLLPLKLKGAGLRLSTARWRTGEGADLNEKGLTPRLTLVTTPEDSPGAVAQRQFEAALRAARDLAPAPDSERGGSSPGQSLEPR